MESLTASCSLPPSVVNSFWYSMRSSAVVSALISAPPLASAAEKTRSADTYEYGASLLAAAPMPVSRERVASFGIAAEEGADATHRDSGARRRGLGLEGVGAAGEERERENRLGHYCGSGRGWQARRSKDAGVDV